MARPKASELHLW